MRRRFEAARHLTQKGLFVAIFRTCKNCVLEKQPCVRREAVRRAIRGCELTSLKMVCRVRAPLYGAGQRVSVTWPVLDLDGQYNEESWPATVIKEVGARFLIKVDDVRSDNDTPASGFLKNASRYAKVSVTKLRPLDEAPQTVCGQCGRVGVGALGEDGCWANPPPYPYTPYGCTSIDEQAASKPAAPVSDDASGRNP